jgi:hypothetical protein
MLSHSLVRDSLPPYFSDLSIKQNLDIGQNIKQGMNTHLMGQQESKVVMAKDIVCSLPVSQVVSSERGIVRLLVIDK